MRVVPKIAATAVTLFVCLSTPTRADGLSIKSVGDNEVHVSLTENQRKLPKKILVLPLDLTVTQLNAGSTSEKLEKESKEVQALYLEAIKKTLDKSKSADRFSFYVPEKDITKEEVEKTLALYDIVAGSALQNKGMVGWNERAKRFDYTLGPTLKQIGEETGADAVLVVIGEDYVSSGGRMAMAIIGTILLGSPIIPVSPSYMTFGLVDVKTGDLLWLYSNFSAYAPLNNPDAAKTHIDGSLNFLLENLALQQ